jgi:3-hydroxypropanoate dehydrogenase
MTIKLDESAAKLLFTEARTHNGWRDEPVTDAQLEALWDLMKYPPTSANGMPARLLFVRSKAAKERLKPHLSPGNAEKTMSAPVTAIVGYDVEFWKRLPELFPHNDMTGAFRDNPKGAELTAFRNGTLQGAYLILAARAVGLDCGPMSGFDNAGVDAEFFAGTTVESNFLCNLGRGDPSKIFGRSPRLAFAEACKIL